MGYSSSPTSDSIVVPYQIYVMDEYRDGWRFYSEAYDSNGKRMDFRLISRDVGSCAGGSGCSHYEHIGLNVTREYLEAARLAGVRVKVDGKAGSEVFFVSGGYIQGFLAAVDTGGVALTAP